MNKDNDVVEDDKTNLDDEFDQNAQIDDMLSEDFIIDDSTIDEKGDDDETELDEEKINEDTEEKDKKENTTFETEEEDEEELDKNKTIVEDEIIIDGDKTIVDDKFVEMQKQNQILVDKINELSGKLIDKDNKKAVKDVDDADDANDAKIDLDDFIGDLDIDNVVSDKKVFNEVLTRALKKIEDKLKNKYEGNLSENVRTHTDNHLEMKKIVDTFYTENSDLTNVKSAVQAVAVDIIKKNPNMILKDVFIKAAEGTREMLGIKKNIVNDDKDKNKTNKKPAFVKKSQGVNKQKSSTKTSRLQNDIDELL